MKSLDNITQINSYFERLVTQVGLNNANGFTDINAISEDFYAKLLDVIFSTKLENLNLKKLNFPAIDLGDDEERLCFQVTSTNSKAKVEKTLDRFSKYKLYKQYDRLQIAVISVKKSIPKTPLKIPEHVVFDVSNDLLCVPDLIRKIQGLNLHKQLKILSLFQSEFDSHSSESVSNETETLIELIDYLSKNKSLPKKEINRVPDPEGKIRHHFSEHSSFLESEIVRLIPMYAKAKEEVWKIKGYNALDTEHIKIYLQNESSRILNENSNDPLIALDSLTKAFEKALSKSGKKYDYTAIRFFIVDELVKCNVFPI